MHALVAAGFTVALIDPRRVKAFRTAEGLIAKTDRLTGLPLGKIARATCAVWSGTTYVRFASNDIAHPWLAWGRIVAQAHRAGRPLIAGATPNSPPTSLCVDAPR